MNRSVSLVSMNRPIRMRKDRTLTNNDIQNGSALLFEVETVSTKHDQYRRVRFRSQNCYLSAKNAQWGRRPRCDIQMPQGWETWEVRPRGLYCPCLDVWLGVNTSGNVVQSSSPACCPVHVQRHETSDTICTYTTHAMMRRASRDIDPKAVLNACEYGIRLHGRTQTTERCIWGDVCVVWDPTCPHRPIVTVYRKDADRPTTTLTKQSPWDFWWDAFHAVVRAYARLFHRIVGTGAD